MRKVLWEQTRCRYCRFFPNCPRNGDLRGVLVEPFFAEKCVLFEPSRESVQQITGKHLDKLKRKAQQLIEKHIEG